MADAGKIMFTLKGDYDETVHYEILDVVTYDSSLYVSRINNNLGYAPSDTEKWQLLIQKSDVVGVKGDAETDYRTGLINITPSDIGLGDLKDVAFSGDYADLSNTPKDWESNTLNTLAEIEAATEENLIAGALAVKELFTSVSNGKELVASAITDKGVDTASDATFQTMADNISNINTGIDFDAVMPYWYDTVEYKITDLTKTIYGLPYSAVSDVKGKGVLILGGYATSDASTAYIGFADNSNLMSLATSGKNYGSFNSVVTSDRGIWGAVAELNCSSKKYTIMSENVDFTKYAKDVNCFRLVIPDAQKITLLYGDAYSSSLYTDIEVTIPDDDYRYRIVKINPSYTTNSDGTGDYKPYILKLSDDVTGIKLRPVQPIMCEHFYGGKNNYTYTGRLSIQVIENLKPNQVITAHRYGRTAQIILLVKSYEKY